MSAIEPARTVGQQASKEGLEALGRILQDAFPLCECRSFIGLMDAIDADGKTYEKVGEPI